MTITRETLDIAREQNKMTRQELYSMIATLILAFALGAMMGAGL